MNRNTVSEDLWQFSPIPNIEEADFNKVLGRFYGLGVAGLTRENIQNSLDGRLPDSELPVIVKIRTGEMERSEIPGIESVMKRIECLEGRNSYSKETIEHMQTEMKKERVKYISFEDENTRGLTGAKYGQSNSKEHTWGIYAYNKGVHFEEDDETFEASRGGSHGVGKIASNAASDLHLMFFANCDAKNEQHIGGTIQLIEHDYHGQCYRSSGYFTKVEQSENTTKFMPFENHYGNVFQKDTRGLKIVIPFLRESFYNGKEVIQSVCDSFFMSILEKKLIVYVNDLKIDHDEIVSIVQNEKYYTQEIEEMKKVFTPLYVDTYLNEEPYVIEVKNLKETFTFNLYFNYHHQIPRGRVAIIRTIGMKIEDFRVKNNATKPFNAVLIGGLKEDSYLKSLENESHTAISAKDIKDPYLKRNATRFINQLSAQVANIIEEKMKEHNPTDGEIDTADLLYTMEIEFKENLSESFETVKINKGKSLVTGQGNDKDFVEDGKESRRKPSQKKKVDPTHTPIRRSGKRPGDGEEMREIGEEEKVTYKITSNRVERLITQEDEFIRLNLNGSEELKNAQRCNLKFSIVDGMGNEYANEFNMLNNYVEVEDQNTQEVRKIRNDAIQNVAIEKGTVNLRLRLSQNYNRSLKFVYYVEV